MRAELPSIHIRLLNALASYLAQPVKRHAASPSADPQDLAAVLVHGDVLLTDGNTRVAALVRRVTRSPWSHVAMYVGPLEAGPDPRCIVEADIAAGVRAVRLSELTGLRVRVLRRRGLDDAQRRQLAGWVVGRIGGQYDLAHALALAKRLLLPPLASRPAPAPAATAHAQPGSSARRCWRRRSSWSDLRSCRITATSRRAISRPLPDWSRSRRPPAGNRKTL